MAVITASIDPITRIEGHLKVEVDIDTVGGVQQVVDARAIGTLFRGFEKFLEGRDPRDAPIITSRICGVCPTAHSMAAVLMLDSLYGVTINDTARLMRNLVHGACFLESDILHFYLLCLPDYIRGPGMAPFSPGWEPGRRIDPRSESLLLQHYLQAIDLRRKCHEMGAVLGGKLPHTPAFIAGGFTAVASAANKTKFQTLLTEIVAFVRDVYIPDTERLASLYSDYLALGRGYGNLMSFGVFEMDAGSTKLLGRGRVTSGSSVVQAVDVAQITEHVTYSWYADSTHNKPPASGETVAQYPKGAGYSWLKAPRYGGVPYEVGPLARMVVNGDYAGGVSVMDRHIARARECLKIALAMQAWLTALPTATGAFTSFDPATLANPSTLGLTEAPRGALGHWITAAPGQISAYQVITPTCWNCSPRDASGQMGAMEKALVGIPVARVDQPVEVLRVVHSFDPCLDCATHVMRPGKDATVYRFGRPPAPVRGRG